MVRVTSVMRTILTTPSCHRSRSERPPQTPRSPRERLSRRSCKRRSARCLSSRAPATDGVAGMHRGQTGRRPPRGLSENRRFWVPGGQRSRMIWLYTARGRAGSRLVGPIFDCGGRRVRIHRSPTTALHGAALHRTRSGDPFLPILMRPFRCFSGACAPPPNTAKEPCLGMGSIRLISDLVLLPRHPHRLRPEVPRRSCRSARSWRTCSVSVRPWSGGRRSLRSRTGPHALLVRRQRLQAS